MYRVDKGEKSRIVLDLKENVTVKNEVIIDVLSKKYCIGEFIDGSVKCYVLNKNDIESTWLTTEFERNLYDGIISKAI